MNQSNEDNTTQEQDIRTEIGRITSLLHVQEENIEKLYKNDVILSEGVNNKADNTYVAEAFEQVANTLTAYKYVNFVILGVALLALAVAYFK